MHVLPRLVQQIARHVGEGLTPTAIQHVSLFSAVSPTQPVAAMADCALALVVQGSKRTVLADRKITYGPGEYLVGSVAVPVTGAVTRATVTEPFLALVVHLDPAAIGTLLPQTAPGPERPALSCALTTSPATPAMLDVAARLVGLLDHPHDIAALAPLYERELLWRLLTSEQGTMVSQIGRVGSHINRIGHAIGWIRAHYDEPLRVDQLAALSAMSPRTLHRHFRAVTRMSPLEYQKQLRLHEARARLPVSTNGVAGVGYDVGYDNPSQFSREYRRMFGAPPSSDLSHTA